MTAPAGNRVLALRPAADPASPELVPVYTDPMAIARYLLKEKTEEGQYLIRLWRGRWMSYRGPHWANGETIALDKWVYERLEHAVCEVRNARTGRMEIRAWAPNRSKVNDVMAAVSVITLLGEETEPPLMLDTEESAQRIIPCANGLLDSITRTLDPVK